MEEPLTDAQRETAGQNHNLIYTFAHKKNISTDEYYDILAIGLCKAAKGYVKGKYKFSTYAFVCMNNELNSYWRSVNKKSSVPSNAVLSYDTQSDDDVNGFVNNFVECSTYDELLCDMSFNEFMNTLDSNEKFIIECLMKGMTQKEISDKMDCTRQNISNHMSKLYKKAVKFLSY